MKIKQLYAFFMTLVIILTTLVPTSAFAAGKESDTATSVSVNTSGGGYYITSGKNIAVKKKASNGAQTDFKIQQNTLVKVRGTSGKYYQLDMPGTRYVKKDSVRKAGNSFSGQIYYTVKDTVLRPSPYEGSTTASLSKGTALVVVGKVTNAKGNQWLAVSYNGGIHYIYYKNVAHADRVTIKVSAPSHTVDTLGKLQLKASVSPQKINYTWSSSNPQVAKVNIAGVVTGVNAGTATITASVNGIVRASLDINVTRYVNLNVKAYRQTKDYTCSAASALAVLRYYGEATDVNDVTLYKSTKGYVGKTTSAINKYLGSTYQYSTFNNAADYENAIYKSLSQGSPVIARVKFPKKFFNYNSTGHYTTIIGMYKGSDGHIWLKLVDSYIYKYNSNSYANKETGIVTVPLKTLYTYGTYDNTSPVYLIHNP